jgi:hypothetical protein
MKILIVKNINNDKKKYRLTANQTLLIKDSNYSHLILNAVINKIIIENCTNLYIDFDNLKIMNNIEINNCDNIFINITKKNIIIPSIELYKTTLYLIGDIKIYKNILILSELSNLYNIF